MGEYADLVGTGERVKIGTCEDMYYLRWDQAHTVSAVPGNVDPIKDRDALRFRFPWPDEDRIAVGEHDDHDRGLPVDVPIPAELDDQHGKVQFSSSYPRPGYLVSLPCPESSKGKELEALYRIHRNGMGYPVELVQQRWHEGRLVGVLRCACGMRWRLSTIEDAQPVLDHLRDVAKGHERRVPGSSEAERYNTIADRLEAGYSI